LIFGIYREELYGTESLNDEFQSSFYKVIFMKNIFKTSMDIRANDTTVAITLILGMLITGFLVFQSAGKLITGFASLFLLAVYIETYLFRPVSYEINDDFLVIHRPGNDVSISRRNLKKAELIDEEKLKHATGTFRIIGLFGYFGKCANGQLGGFTMYATRRNKTVLIETSDNRKVVLTPDRPAKFIKQLKVSV
jgi:hypothetical protein